MIRLSVNSPRPPELVCAYPRGKREIGGDHWYYASFDWDTFDSSLADERIVDSRRRDAARLARPLSRAQSERRISQTILVVIRYFGMVEQIYTGGCQPDAILRSSAVGSLDRFIRIHHNGVHDFGADVIPCTMITELLANIANSQIAFWS